MDAAACDWTEKLIECIESKPALYDKNRKDYNDRLLKENLWEEVCKTLDPTWNQRTTADKANKGLFIQKKWRNLRTCFVRELKAQQKDPKALQYRKRRKYIYFDKLIFLLNSTETTEMSSKEDDPIWDDDEPFNLYNESTTSSTSLLEGDDINIVKFIDEVEKRPALYDKSVKEYWDVNLKRNLYEQICQILINDWGVLSADDQENAVNDVQKKWKNIRTCFARELKAQKEPKSEQKSSKRRKYIYYDNLLFLLPIIESCQQNTMLEDPDYEESEENGNPDNETILQTSIFDGDNSEKIIEEVEKRPNLYDKNFSDVNGRRILWDEICETLINDWNDLPPEDKKKANIGIQKKWRNLKTCFSRELKAQRNTLPGHKYRRKYIYFNKMLFLLSSMEDGQLSSNVEDVECVEPVIEIKEEPYEHEHENETDTQILIPCFSETLLTYEEPPLKKMEKNKDDPLNMDSHFATSNDETHFTSSNGDTSFASSDVDKQFTPLDGDTHFALSLVPKLRALSEEDKLEAQIQILNIFKVLKLKSVTSITPR